MIKGPIYLEDIVINIYALRASKPMKQNSTELKEKIDTSTVLVGDFTIPLLIMNRTK